MFYNGNIRPSSIHHSRIVEYDLETKKLVWSYMMIPLLYMGSVQKLWNGNVFIVKAFVDCLK